jgi:hypothetical protein
VLLDSSRQYLSNDTGGVVIGVSMCLQSLFFFPFFLSPLSSLFIESCVQQFYNLKGADDTCNSQIADDICDSLNHVIFLNIFCTTLLYLLVFFFHYAIVPKYSRNQKKKDFIYLYVIVLDKGEI